MQYDEGVAVGEKEEEDNQGGRRKAEQAIPLRAAAADVGALGLVAIGGGDSCAPWEWHPPEVWTTWRSWWPICDDDAVDNKLIACHAVNLILARGKQVPKLVSRRHNQIWFTCS